MGDPVTTDEVIRTLSILTVRYERLVAENNRLSALIAEKDRQLQLLDSEVAELRKSAT